MTEAEDLTADDKAAVSRRRMLGLAGGGIAAAAVVAAAAPAGAIEGEPVLVGGDYTGTSATSFSITGTEAAVLGTNTAVMVPIAGAANAVKGVVSDATNGSHAVLGTTAGDGHAVAGVCTKVDNARGATWGRHLGAGAGVEGENKASMIALAGPANGVKGIVTEVTNGSHAVLGITNGAGHSVAGDTPAGPNTTAATWGRHGGAGAGIGGVSATGYGGEFVGGRASVRLIPSAGVAVGEPTDVASKGGELFVDGAGDLFYNVADGANFTRLNTQTVLFDDPQRAYDSRTGFAPNSGPKGAFAANQTKTIDLTTETDLPAGASGALLNVTIANTTSGGFITVYNGDSVTKPNTSSVNWSAAGQILSNAITVKIGAAGTVKVFANSPTNVVIDVIGFLV